MLMKNKTKLIIAFSVMLLAIVALIAVWMIPVKNGEPVVSETPVNAENTVVTVNIKAVGDNLIHSPVYKSCKTENGYNFDSVYSNICGYIEDADIAAINQETIFVEDESRLSGYPTFGSPTEVGESTRKAGFNVVTHATNHTIDKGADAILYTKNFWDNYDDVTVLGINRSEEEQQTVEVWEKDGLKIAMLNFTYGLNGFSLPKENAALIRKAEESADITLVFIHFGTEYTHSPTTGQKEDVEFLCENGADVIIGTHPHVVQPATKHISENGNEAVVFYSLGNFLSNQNGASKILGAMADVTITKENGTAKVESYNMYPTVTHCSGGKYSVYMLDDYTDELAHSHTRAPGLTVEKLRTLYDKIINIEV